MRIRLHRHRHCGGFIFGGSKASTSTTDARTAASEGSIAVGQSAKYLEAGGLDVSGSSGAKIGTTDVIGDVSITTADPLLFQKAIDAYRDISLGTTSQFSSFAKAQHEQQAEDLATLLGSLGKLESQTDDESKEQRTILYIVLGLLALLGVVFWPRR